MDSNWNMWGTGKTSLSGMMSNDASTPRIALAPSTTTIRAEYVIFLDISFTIVHDTNAHAARTTVDTNPTIARLPSTLATKLL